MMFKTVGSVVVLTVGMCSAADVLYWNPTDVKKGAGSGAWTAGVNAWTSSSSGTTEPEPWVDGSDAYFTLNSGANTATVNNVTANYVRFGSGQTWLLPGTGPLTIGAGGVKTADKRSTFETPIVLAADQDWYIGTTTSNHCNTISGSGELRKTATGSLYNVGSDFQVDVTVVDGNMYYYGGGAVAKSLKLGDASQWRTDNNPGSVYLMGGVDAAAGSYTAAGLVAGGTGILYFKKPSGTLYPSLHVGTLSREGRGTIRVQPDGTVGTECHLYIDEAPTMFGALVAPWLADRKSGRFLSYDADAGELVNATVTDGNGEWTEADYVRLNSARTIDGTVAANAVDLGAELTVPEGAELRLRSGGASLWGNIVGGGVLSAGAAGEGELVFYSQNDRTVEPVLSAAKGLTVYGGGNVTLKRPYHVGDTWVNNGKVTYSVDSDLTPSGAFFGPGELVKTGTGTLTFQGTTNVLGRFTPAAGNVVMRDASLTVSNFVTIGSSSVSFRIIDSMLRYGCPDVTYHTGPFSTGSGNDSVSVEVVNTTSNAGGCLVDGGQFGIVIGENASGCSLLVDGGSVTRGAIVTNMYYNKKGFHLGVGANACNNVARIVNGGYLRDDLTVNNDGNSIGRGDGCNNNLLEIVGGEGFVSELHKEFPGQIGKGAASGNRIVVDGRGTAGSAQLTCRSEALAVGHSGATANELRVIDGGRADGMALTIGLNACSNSVTVSGAGSVVYGPGGSGALTVGSGDSGYYSEGNTLYIKDGGLVENFSKWTTVVGGHENNSSTGSTIGNGVEITDGGVWSTPNNAYIGRIKGAGSVANYNFVHVTGEDSQWRVASDKQLVVGVATSTGDADEGAVALGNELTVDDGGYVFARNVYLSRETTSKVPGGVTGNRIAVSGNGTVAALYEMAAGLSGDAEDASAAVVVNNSIIAERGGVLEARTFRTYSGNGNTIVARDGGALQFFEKDPNIQPFEAGSIALDGGVVSFTVDGCDVNKLATSTKTNGLKDLSVSGRNAFRLTDCMNSVDVSQDYVFGDVEPADARHFVRLEMMSGETEYRGREGDALTIAATGSMLCSNTAARISLPVELKGPLSLVNSSLEIAAGGVLDATVTIDLDRLPESGAPLELGEGVTLGANAKFILAGEPVEGATVCRTSSDIAFAAALPQYWRLRSTQNDGATEYYLDYFNPGGTTIIIR